MKDLENHVEDSAQEQQRPRSSTARFEIHKPKLFGKEQYCRDTQQWRDDCMKWRGRILTGEQSHWCYGWDGLPVDETTPEWPCECAQPVNEERGVSDSTPQKEQRGSPNPSGAA